MARADKNSITEYLLGRLTEPDEEQVELRLLTDPEFAEEYDLVVNEIIDDYISGKFGESDRKQVEEYFFKSPQRRNKLKFALALKQRKSEIPSYLERRKTADYPPKPTALPWWHPQTFKSYRPYLAIAATLFLVVGGYYIWRAWSDQSDLNRGLMALRTAYKNERPTEARLSDFNYAPVPNQRGGAPKIDYVKRDLAAALLIKEADDHPGAASLQGLGQYYLANREPDKAIEQFNRALEFDPNNAKIQSDLGAALLEKGKAQASGSDKGKEFETFAQSLDHLNAALKLDSGLLEAYFNRALAYQYMLLMDQAEQAWRDYLQRDPSSPWTEEARRQLGKLESEDRKSSRNENAALNDFLSASRSGDDDTAWKILADQYTSGGNRVSNKLLDSMLLDTSGSNGFDSALQALSYLAKLESNRAGDRYSSDLVQYYQHQPPEMRVTLAEARGHMVAGYDLFLKSSYKRAIEEYRAARLKYVQTGDEPEQVFVDYRLAHCYIFFNPNLARPSLERLSHIYKAKGYRWLLGQALYGLAHVSGDSREYSKAIDYSGQALAEMEGHGDVNGVLKCLTQLADFNQWLNRVSRSLVYVSRALALAGERAAPGQKWSMLTQMGLNMSSMQLHSAALLYHQEALRFAFQTKIPLLISRSHGYVGATYGDLKLYPQAIDEVTKEIEIGESIQEKAGRMEIKAKSFVQLGDIRRQSGDCDKAETAYDESILLYRDLKQVYYEYAAHKGKFRCLIDDAEDTKVRKELEIVLNLCKIYRSEITAESQRDSFFAMEQPIYDLAIYYDYARAGDPLRAFEHSEESRARSLRDAVQGGASIEKKVYDVDLNLPAVKEQLSLSEVQNRMPKGAQILQYAILQDRVLMWVVTPSEIHLAEAPIQAQTITEKVRAYLANVNGPPSAGLDESHEQAKELYAILIAPAERFLEKSKFLCVVPDKILNYLSFDALVAPTDRYLVQDYQISTAPSSTTFVELSAMAERKAGAFEEKLLSVGNPDFSRARFDSFSDLPAAASEAEAVAKLYRHPRLLLGDDAKETTIKSEIRQADVAHFAMHYLSNDESEMLSGFPLTPENSYRTESGADGFLQFYEIYAMKSPRTRLVVLSACQTGIEKQYDGEGVVGVARPFLVTGVPTVVASLWPVDSDASAELMVAFHRHRIHDRLPVAQALRQAKIGMIEGADTSYRRPYYWAAFLVIGGQSTY